MSWASTIAGSVNSPNQSSRNGRKVTGWIIHHNASMGGQYVLGLMASGEKQVSANYQVLQNGDVWGVVPRENRSWSASNAAWDAASLTFEIANDSGEPGWTIPERAYVRVAATIAEDSVWAGIPINRTTVRGHREGSAQGDGGSYATACPGGINLDRLVQMANQIKSSGLAGLDATPIKNELGDVIMRYFWAPNREGIVTTETDGVFFPANAEEAQALSKAYNGLDVTTREWDVLRQAALNRAAAAGKPESDAVTAAINKAIDAKLSGAKVDVKIDAQEIAKSVRAEFEKNPLS